MLVFQDILHAPTPEFAQAWALYEGAFPVEERRTKAQQEALLQHTGYSFKGIFQEEELVGLLGIWTFEEFTFLEHFAIISHMRGRGVGKAALSLLLESVTLPILLEVESPIHLPSQRRISFYQQLGFCLNSFPYLQPPYGPDKSWVPLQIMSLPDLLSPDAFSRLRSNIYLTVYKVSVP